MENIFEQWLSQDLIDSLNVTHLGKSFSEAQPFSYLEIPQFFQEEILNKLIHELGEETFIHKTADLFSFHQTNDIVGSSNEFLLSIRDFLSSPAFVGLLSKITGFSLKEGEIDLHSTMYLDADFLLCHDDQLEGRKIAFMVYLSDLEKGDGGTLELYGQENGEPTSIVKRIVPKKNTFVFFEVSPDSFHSVSEMIKDKERLTLAGWFHE